MATHCILFLARIIQYKLFDIISLLKLKLHGSKSDNSRNYNNNGNLASKEKTFAVVPASNVRFNQTCQVLKYTQVDRRLTSVIKSLCLRGIDCW